MSVECFLDTNVLVYAVGGRGVDEWKRIRAFELMEPAQFGTSGQVLQEFYINVTRKIKTPISTVEAATWVDRLSTRPVAPVDTSLIKVAIEVSQRYRISYWDGAIVAAAMSLDAPILYSEDLNHGQSYSSVRVVNPFRPQ